MEDEIVFGKINKSMIKRKSVDNKNPPLNLSAGDYKV
jgi:hypothetical protein